MLSENAVAKRCRNELSEKNVDIGCLKKPSQYAVVKFAPGIAEEHQSESFMTCSAALIMPIFPLSYVRLPWKNAV